MMRAAGAFTILLAALSLGVCVLLERKRRRSCLRQLCICLDLLEAELGTNAKPLADMFRDLSSQIETLTRLHIQHGLQRTPGFDAQKNSITRLIRDNEIDLNRELDPLTRNLYRRYFE